MRIATLLPLYSIFSFIPICFPNTYVYMFGWIEVVQGIALYSFLMLLCDLLTPNDQQRVFFFASLRIPGRKDKTKTTDGLMWLQVRHWYLLVHLHEQITNRTWFLVLQYSVVAFIIAIAQCITEAIGIYCLESNNRHFAHLWVRRQLTLMIILIANIFTARYHSIFVHYLCYHGHSSILRQSQISHARTQAFGKAPRLQDGRRPGLSRKGETNFRKHTCHWITFMSDRCRLFS